MEDKKFFDIDEAMVDYAEMTSFDFKSSQFISVKSEKDLASVLNSVKVNVFDKIQSMFSKGEDYVESI